MTELDHGLEVTFDLSRDSDDYEATEHLEQRLRSGGLRSKVIDGELICKAIDEGEVDEVRRSPKDDVEVNFRYEWLQTTIKVGVDPFDEVVKTAFEVES
jgi:hypothetical protein